MFACKVLLGVACSLFVVATANNNNVEFHEMEGQEIRDDHYIAIFHPHLSETNRNIHLSKHTALANADPHSEIKNSFSMGNFSGYHGKFSQTLLQTLMEESKCLKYIQRDSVVKIDAPIEQNIDLDPAAGFNPNLEHHTNRVQLHPDKAPLPSSKPLNHSSVHSSSECYKQTSAVWGLVRSSQRTRQLNGQYYFDNLGAGVDAYVIDTGIYTGHSQFGGRARFGASFTGESHQSDLNGHGTHCAGTIGAETYGIAKSVNLVGVQVLSATGSGYMSWVVSGVDWVCSAHKASSSGNKCVVNLSLGGGYYNTLNNAVNSLVSCGCTVAVAAGNEGANACSSSPASAEKAIAVGATDNSDQRAYFSNYGSCVDIFAPGVYITSTWIGSAYAINTISGTSMASPHVAGAAAKVVSATGLTGEDVNKQLVSDATSGYLSNIGDGSPNLLLYEACA